MPARPTTPFIAARRLGLFAALSLAALSAQAEAGSCNSGCGGRVTIVKPMTVIKPITINKSISINKPVTINKPITINKTIDASKTITIDKSVTINKSIVINKGNSEASAFAAALAVAGASASAGASANVVVYGGYGIEDVSVHNHYEGNAGGVRPSLACRMQEATVVKAIHAVCVSADGREFPASHMTEETFLPSGTEGEILRCIPGLTLKVSVNDMLPSDQGMAAAQTGGQTIMCAPHEALRHYKDGVLKCAPAVPVPDCTERSNLRKFGSGDLFFSYRTRACVVPTEGQEAAALDLSAMPLDGGVGE